MLDKLRYHSDNGKIHELQEDATGEVRFRTSDVDLFRIWLQELKAAKIPVDTTHMPSEIVS